MIVSVDLTVGGVPVLDGPATDREGIFRTKANLKSMINSQQNTNKGEKSMPQE